MNARTSLMKQTVKTSLLSVFALVLQPCFGQDWFPDGAFWHYNHFSGSFEGYMRIDVSGDTVVEGQAARKLLHHWKRFNHNDGLIYEDTVGTTVVFEDSGIVWIHVPQAAAFDTLYDFNAVPGATWQMAPVPMEWWCDSNQVQVVDTGNIVVDGVPLRWLAIESVFWNPFPYPFQDTIIERIGTLRTYLLPYDRCLSGVDGSIGGPLRCYEDDVLSFSRGTVACDYLAGVSDMQAIGLALYPNPGSTQLLISWDPTARVERVTVRNGFGRMVRDIVPSTSSFSIPTHAWAAGVYTIHFVLPGSAAGVVKWIKE